MNLNHLYKILFISLLLSFTIQSCINNEKAKTAQLNVTNDSITIWIKASKNKSYSINKRKKFLIKSYQTIKSSKIDTLQLRSLISVAYRNFKLGDTLLFKKRNKEALTNAIKLKDSFSIGDVHWNYASYYNKIQVYDSAYYHFNLAHAFFNKKGYEFESAKTQYGMAFIKGRFKDYSGSEISTFKAIKKFKKLKDYKSLYSSYDHLGQLQNDIQEYDKGLFYHNKSLDYVAKLKNNQSLYEASLNNIGNTYFKKGDYTTAIEYYNKVLDNESLKAQNINNYARVLSNKAYCQLLMKDTVRVYQYLNEALHIRDSLKHNEGIVISKIHLAHYYAFKQDTTKAINFARVANNLSKDIKNSRNYLETLSLLAKLDIKHSSNYLKKHIIFSDSLQIVERKNQNKFTRISYETDEYIAENKLLSQQKTWILAISLGGVLILGLLFFIKIQKSKTEKLVLENKQQKSNEQIYLITLKQQEKLEKEKIKERNRIAEELHDGILGKLFGTRIALEYLGTEGNEDKKKYQLLLDELQIIGNEIREMSHKLSDNSDSSQISFTTIITQLLNNKCKIANFKYELDFDEHINWQEINEIIKVNLFRISQETLQNCIKYASAKNVTVSFLLDNGNLVMMIKDDGIGFNVEQKKKGIGIKNIKSRTEKLNGVFNIYSKLNEGTTVKVQIPI